MISTTPTPGSPHRITSTSASAEGSASLRPRANKLISGIDEFSPDFYIGASTIGSPSATPLDSPFLSRAQSPIPSKHPSRSSSINPQFRQPVPSEEGSDLAASLSGLWGRSWTSIQGLASTVLGSDATVEQVKDKAPQTIRRPRESFTTRLSPDSKQWGPSKTALTQPGGGSKEERSAQLRARKREELLRGSNNLHSNNSRIKRRTSDDFESSSAPPGDDADRDALVYIHHVSPQDTLPGLSIKFNCPLATIKKTNRLWSNDSIQFKKTIVLPVDECNIKGQRVRGPETDQESLLTSSPDDDEKTPKASTHNLWQTSDDPLARQDSTATMKPTTTSLESPLLSSQKPAEEPPWKHDSWVLLTNHPTAIEIARLPRQNLGFFPRARRKSPSFSHYSDGHSTPSTSLDLSRPSITISDTSATDRIVQQQQQRRVRRSSSTKRFGTMMVGPGGVGSLGGKGPSAPGPAEDKLSKVLGKLPSIMAPAIDDSDLYVSGASTPTVGLEQMGSAIEGWVRKMAKTAVKAVEPMSAVQSKNQPRVKTTGIRPRSVDGDMIELNDAFEVGEEDEENEEDEDDEYSPHGLCGWGKDRAEWKPWPGEDPDGVYG